MPAPEFIPTSDPSRRGKLILKGKEYTYGTAKDALILVLTTLAKEDPSFLERCANHPDIRGRKRQYIARKPHELYPDRPDLHSLHEKLPDGWVLATNISNAVKLNILHTVAEVAGLRFGSDLQVNF